MIPIFKNQSTGVQAASLILRGESETVLEGQHEFRDPGYTATGVGSVLVRETRVRGSQGDLIDQLTLEYVSDRGDSVRRVVWGLNSRITLLSQVEIDGEPVTALSALLTAKSRSIVIQPYRKGKISVVPQFRFDFQKSAVRVRLFTQTISSSGVSEVEIPIQVGSITETRPDESLDIEVAQFPFHSGSRYRLEVSGIYSRQFQRRFDFVRQFDVLWGDLNRDGVLSQVDLDAFIERRANVESGLEGPESNFDLEYDGQTSLDFTQAQLGLDQALLEDWLHSRDTPKSILPSPPAEQADSASRSFVLEAPYLKPPEREAPSISEEIQQLHQTELHTLVLFNENTLEGRPLAVEYAQMRGVPLQNLCGLRVTPGHYATLAELRSVREQVVDCICSLDACATRQALDVSRASRFSHLVYVGEIPERLIQTGWTALTPDGGWTVTADQQEPIFDYVLARSIYEDHFLQSDYRGQGVPGSLYFSRSNPGAAWRTEGDRYGLYVGALNASADRTLAFGRLPGLGTEGIRRAMRRAFQAETTGPTGNFFLGLRTQGGDHDRNLPGVSYPTSDPALRFLSDLSGGNASGCVDYLTKALNTPGVAGSTWSPGTCRVGATARGEVPGESGSSVSRAIQAELYIGNEYLGQGQTAFDGFQALLNWRKTSTACTPLCRDLADPAERVRCALESTDVLRELNTACVGVNPGFVGWQYRSWPAQYYGLFPAGWTTTEYGYGEKTPPELVESGGAASPVLGDTRFIRWGSRQLSSDARCIGSDGQWGACRSRFAVSLVLPRRNVPAGVQIRGGDTLTLRLATRASHAGGFMGAHLELWTSTGYRTLSRPITPPSGAATWSSTEASFLIPSEYGEVREYGLSLGSGTQGLSGTFDLDQVELTFGKVNLIPADIGSFSRSETTQTNPGDWPATVVERLGGSGFWGSAQHHLTGGHAFASSHDLMTSYFSGRTLGEAIQQAGRGGSGLIYVDPLLRPQAVKIFDANGRSSSRGTYLHASGLHVSIPLKLNAFLGRMGSQWALEICDRFKTVGQVKTCEVWRTLRQYNQPAYEFDPNIEVADLIEDDRVSQTLHFRLKVFRPGAEHLALMDTFQVQFSPRIRE